jgi:hypothetical protein
MLAGPNPGQASKVGPAAGLAQSSLARIMIWSYSPILFTRFRFGIVFSKKKSALCNRITRIWAYNYHYPLQIRVLLTSFVLFYLHLFACYFTLNKQYVKVPSILDFVTVY